MTLRLFFSNATAGYTPPTFENTWELTTGSVVRKLGPKSGSLTTVSVAETSTSTTYDVALGRFVSDPFLRGGTLNTDTIRLVYGHGCTVTSSFFSVISVWVTAGDSGTVRGRWTPSGAGRVSGTAWSTATVSQRWSAFAPGAFGDATIAVQAGDRLVFELGARAATTTGTSRTATLYHGGTGTELPDASGGDVTTDAGWVDVTGAVIEALWTPQTAVPTFVSSGAYLDGTSSSTAVFTAPGGMVADDIILIALYKENSDAVTAPSGFTAVDTPAAVTTGNTQWHYLFWKRATASEPSSYSFSWTGSAYRAGQSVAIRGCLATGSPVDVFNKASNSSASSSTPAVAVTSTGADRLLVWSGSCWNTTVWTTPTDFTLRGSTNETVQAFATRAWPTASATGNVTATNNDSATTTAWLVALRPISGATVTGTALVALSGPTTTAVGLRKVTGTSALALAGPTVTASGVVVAEVITGTALVALAGPTVIAVGLRRVTGTAAVTLGGIGLSALGARRAPGTAVVALGGIGVTTVGTRTTSGVGAVALGAISVMAAGVVVAEVVTGSAVAQLGALSVTTTGHRTTRGSALIALGPLTLVGLGEGTSQPITGTAVLSLGAVSVTAVGTVIAEVVTGTVQIAIAGPVITAQARRAVPGAAAVTLPGLVLTAAGGQLSLVAGSAVVALGALSVIGTGHQPVQPPWEAGEPIVVPGLRAAPPVALARPGASEPVVVPELGAAPPVVLVGPSAGEPSRP